MSAKKNKVRRPRISSLACDVGRAIHDRLYDGHDPDDHDETLCEEIAGDLRDLTHLAGIELPEELGQHPHKNSRKVKTIFIEAMRAAYDLSDLIGLGQATDEDRMLHEMMFNRFDGIRKACERSCTRKEVLACKEVHTEKSQPHAEPIKYIAEFDWPFYDIHRDDTLSVEEAKHILPGHLILAREEEDGEPVFSRVCLVRDGHVRVIGDEDDDHIEIPVGFVVGRCVRIQHANCVHAKVKALRKQIEKLQSDSDAWSNVTRIYELETEIFNLENPIEEEEDSDSDEWPDEIDG